MIIKIESVSLLSKVGPVLLKRINLEGHPNGDKFERERRQLYLRQREKQREVEFLLEKQKRRMESIDKILDGALARAEETVSQFTPPSSPAKNSNECTDQATKTPHKIKGFIQPTIRTLDLLYIRVRNPRFA